MKKFSMTTLPLLCSVAAPLCADAQGSQTMDKPAPQQQPMNQITPSSEPAVTRWADPYITADFIWWKAKEEGLDYALTGIAFEQLGTANPQRINADKGSVHRPHSEYEPGFKVGAGLKFRHDGWDLFAQYTWLHVDGRKSEAHSDRDGDSNVQSYFGMPRSGALLSFLFAEAEAKWSMHFNVLDLELGRNFWISKWLTLRPFVGMKFSWIDQDFDVEFERSFPTSPNNPSRSYKVDMDLDQSAVGLRAGLDSAWYLWKKWCIYGDLAISGIWNDFDSSRKDRVTFNNITSTSAHFDKDSCTVTAVLEWALGLRFETAFHNDDFMFMMQAGWEQQVWFNQNQFLIPSNEGSSNLSLEGLTLKAGFYF